jgi:geranylgeranyl pyrophosphate synthase
MYEKSTVEERCHRILEDNGKVVAEKTRKMLLDDPTLKGLKQQLEFISKNWRDPLTPAFMRLSCEAVGGGPYETYDVAQALSLMHLCFYIWDDVIDKTSVKSFRPTIFGKFGGDVALIIGGLASAKAFSLLNVMDADKEKRQKINRLIWELWARMGKVEMVNLRLLSRKSLSSSKKIQKIKMEAAADLETCLKIGAILGNGSENEVTHLGNYGLYLGVILELWKDFHVSINLTSALAQKIRIGALPYSVLWAKEHSEKVQKNIEMLSKGDEQNRIRIIVQEILAAKTLNHITTSIKKFTKRGVEELNGLSNNAATQDLRFFIEAQPSLFMGSLAVFRNAKI